MMNKYVSRCAITGCARAYLDAIPGNYTKCTKSTNFTGYEYLGLFTLAEGAESRQFKRSPERNHTSGRGFQTQTGRLRLVQPVLHCSREPEVDA